MKRIILIIMSMLTLAMGGCGAEVSVVIPVSTYYPPAITTYNYSQDILYYYVDGTVEFYAPDNDIDTITVVVLDSRGVEMEHSVTRLSGYAGRTRGTILFTIDYLKYRPDLYSFTIYLTDRAGYISNPVYGSFGA